MNFELPQNPREEMELRITALLLGELSVEDASAVREAIAKDAELSKLHDDLKETIQLVQTVITSVGEPAAEQAAPLQLSEERRQKLLTSFVIPPLKPSHRKSKPVFQFRLIEALAVLAIIAALAAILVVPIGFVRREQDGVTTTTELALSRFAADSALERARAEILKQEPSVAGTDNVQSLHVAGYAQVDPAQLNIVDNRVQVSGQITDPRGNVSLGEKSGEQSQADFQDYLNKAKRSLTAGQPAYALDTTVQAPATPQPRLQIVLPSLKDADTDGIADDGTRPKNRSGDAVERFANGLESTRGLDRNGRGPRGSAEAPAPQNQVSGTYYGGGYRPSNPTEAPTSQNQWAASSTLRGAYDSSGRDAGPDFGLAADAKRSATEEDKVLYDRSVLGRAIAPITGLPGTPEDHDDQTHTINARLMQAFSERNAASLRDSFVIGQEPTTGLPVESDRGLQPAPVPNATSAGGLAFGAFTTEELGRGRASGIEGKAGAVVAGTSVAPGQLYRNYGGAGGGVGGGGTGRGGTVAPPEAAEIAPMLGDLPVLGKTFQSEPGAAAPSDGKLAYDPTTHHRQLSQLEAVASSFKYKHYGRDFESSQEKLSADKQARFDGNNPRDGSTVNAGALALGLPSIEQQKEVPSDNFYAGDKLAVNVGRVVPGQLTFGFEVGDNSAGVPVKPSDAATIVLPSTPAAGAVDELSLGRRVPARSLRLSAPDSGVNAGNTPALVQEGRQLLEAGKPVEAEARLKASGGVVEAGLSEEQQAGVKLERQIAQKQTEVETLRRQLAISEVDAGGTVPTPSLEAESLRRYLAELRESKTKLAELESSVAQSAAISPEQRMQVESAKAGVEKLKELIDNAKQLDVEKSEDSRAYYDKKRELESLRTFERILGIKLAAERIDHTIPRTSMVEIVDKATPAPARKPSLLARLTGNTDSEAKARITVDRDVTDIEGVTGSRSTTGYDPYYIQTQFEIIQSEAVLGKVVESLDLNTIWGKEHANGKKLKTTDAIGLLKGKLELKPVKGTGLVEISAKDADPEVAARIANAVAETYAEHRNQERSRLSQGGIQVLEERYQEQLEKITKAQEEVEALRQRLNISDTDAGGNAPVAPVKVEVDTPLPRKSATNAPIPQPEIQTSENAFSTFSLNVSDVSFKLAAASLEKGQMPDAATVRSEEFINAFDYRDPEAAPGLPIAFAWERTRYPFAHNRDLLRFSLKTAAAGRQAGRPLNVVLLLDNSGSMERGDRVQIIREALRVLAAQLQPQDKLSVITFARTPRLVADGIAGDKAGEVTEPVSELTPQGGTNLEEAMNLAYQTALRHYLTSGINRVVLLTDGAANLGNVEPDALKQKVEAHRKQGVAFDAFGVGWDGFNDDLLEVLSRNGDGRYGFINSPEEAATDFAGQLAGALKVAASDVKVQVEFNPKRVTMYRQIGYAKHQLTKEQFRDNTVDAAEIAAQEAGNALYTVAVNPAGEGPLGTVRVRYKIPGTTDYREQAWDVPFAGNAAPLEHSSPAMRLGASASAFSEWLVASPFAGEVTPDRVLGYLAGVPEIYGADERPKKLEWMIRQAKSLEGK